MVKTNYHVAIKNRGNTLYKKTFGSGDGNCNKLTEKVATQVWNYDGSLSLAFSSAEGMHTIPCLYNIYNGSKNLEVNIVILISARI